MAFRGKSVLDLEAQQNPSLHRPLTHLQRICISQHSLCLESVGVRTLHKAACVCRAGGSEGRTRVTARISIHSCLVSSLLLSPRSADRIQQLRREFHQARREAAAPAYEDLEARRRAGPEYDPSRMAVRGQDGRLAPRYEDVERQYASLPRRGPMDPNDYPMQPWGGHREPAHYPAPQGGYPSYPARDNYPPRGAERRGADPRQGDPGYYPPAPQQRGPLRQDVPPSPPLPLRAPRYDTMNRGGYRNTSPDRYAYADGRNPDPRQTAAV
ncbi:partitioning defective 3 homolog B-like [Anguilla anguilla]|uniref:partitioning defective 3 homolog B-like n=1 Tax=Anguilla anguilla TaxID=7936 RepID=UPI0015A9D680|nr:partitioning defective 3 homolog B-like [Anguilla anguilla]